MGTAFRNEKFRKYIERLERAKTTVLHARLHAHGSRHQQQLSGIKTIQESLSRASSEHSEFVTKSTETARLVQADLQAVPSRVKEVVMSEFSSTMAKSRTTCSTILTEVRASSVKADQTSEEIKLAIRSLLVGPDTNRIAALLQPALEKVISDQIASSMENLTAHLTSPQPNAPKETPESDTDTAVNVSAEPTESQIGVRSLNQLSATTTCIRWGRSSKVINFWFGKLILSTSILESWQGHGNRATLQKGEFLETKATLIPAKWLLRKGMVLKITRLVSAVVAPSIQFSLTPIMVISEDHEIVLAMQYGDLTRVQRLILTGEVHPSSILPNGSSLLHKCIAEMRERALPGLSRETIHTICKMIDLAVWLVAYGSTTDAPNIYGENAFAALDEIFSENMNISRFAYDNPDKLDPLAIAMLHISNSSPFFVRDRACGRLKLTDTLINTWWYYLPLISEESSADASTSFCLKALQCLWGYSPYNQTYELISCDHPEDWAPELSKAAIAGKLWLAGDDCESKRCLHMLYCSIRDALVYASPYRLFSDSYKQTRWPGERKDRYRSDIINAIAEMLRYERRISMYEGRPTLTDCAIKWRCLDIWRLALEKAECQPLSSEIWNDYSHFYDSVGFVSCESGTSICLTTDPSSHKVILAVGERQYDNVSPFERNRRKRYPKTPEFEKLTNDWECVLNLPQVHCEVYPSRVLDKGLANEEHDHSPRKYETEPANHYVLQPTKDGGVELFIDCCEIGEPWKRICEEVEKEYGFNSDDSTEDSCSEGSTDEDRNSRDNEEESGEASTGLFSKIAGVGLDVLSAFV